MKTIIHALALSTLAAAPALAQSELPPRTPAIAAPVQAGGAAVKEAKRYCVDNGVTGSRLSRRTCHTRQQWLTQYGYDPLTDAKK